MILIAGDSWGCGEWSTTMGPNGQRLIDHDGLAGYLLDHGHSVINISEPGGSNSNTIARLENFLLVNKHLDVSHVIVFQTEWIRSAITNQDLQYGYHELRDRIISSFYYNLSRLNDKFGVKFHVIGGCSDAQVISQFEIEYPGVNVICQSFTNLVLHNQAEVDNPVYAVCMMSWDHTEVVDKIKKRLTTSDLELLVNDLQLGLNRTQQWKNNTEFFWPDGIHPNRHAHQILFNYLKHKMPWI